jgi:hypothetical protein
MTRQALALLAALLAAGVAAQHCPTSPVAVAPEPHVFDEAGGVLTDLRWLGADSGFVLALTSGGRLWRSVNGGLNWADDTKWLQGAAENGGVAALVALETAPSRAIVVGRYNATLRQTLLWSTSNHGYSWQQPCSLARGAADCVAAPTDAPLLALKPHPQAAAVLMAITRGGTCDGRSSACVLQDVWLSTDFSRTWTSSLQRAAQGGAASAIASFIDAAWSPEASVPPPPGAQPSNALLATAYLSAEDRTNGIFYAGYWDVRVHLIQSRDLFTSRTLLRRCGNDFRIMSDQRIYLGVAGGCDAPAGTPADGWAVTLDVSHDSGASWKTACFPAAEAEHGYTLYDLNGTDAWVHVDHSDTRDPAREGQPLGVLYHSDGSGQLFSLSKRDVILQPSGVSDFVAAEGLPGVAFANSVDAALWSDPDFTERGTKNAYDAVQTRITRDAGASWAPLPSPAPAPGRAACANADASACALQLHGPDASWRGAFNVSYPGMYTAAGAPGVVWATGSVGRHLSYAPAEVRTFLSLDAGSTWATVEESAHIFETGLSGGLLVMAPFGPAGAATHVMYSVDGGACWATVSLPTPMVVYNIQTRPDNAGLIMLMHGALVGGTQQLALYALDFGALLSQAGASLPACASSDFEAWAPDGCGRGVAAIFTRRKPRARCLPTPPWRAERAASRPCGCSAADYECAFGYERPDGAAASSCTRMRDFAIDPGCPDAAATPTRLIAGDACTSGAPPPSSGKRGKRGGPSGGAVFFIVLLVLACVGSAALVAARLMGLPLPPAVQGGVDDCIDAARGCLGRLRGGGARPLASDDAWLDSADAEFAPLAGSYVPPK